MFGSTCGLATDVDSSTPPSSENWPTAASCCLSDASPSALSSTAQYWARCPPRLSSAPDAISASITRLLQRRRSTRSQKSWNEANGFSARAASIESIAERPTFRIAPRPKRIRLSPTTVNL